jgi:hypothetical protein
MYIYIYTYVYIGMESIEKSFFDELLGQDNTNSFHFADKDNQGLVHQLDGLVHGMSGDRHSSSQEVHRWWGVGVEGSQGLNLNRNLQNKSYRDLGQSSSQVIQARNFDEQDRFSVMQTLIDVHNSTARSSLVHKTIPREIQKPNFESVMQLHPSPLQEKRGYVDVLSFSIFMLTLLLMPLTGLHFCVGLDFVTPSS